ncbi:SPOSA6832_00759, partial [Sporobolomyces salmonicolor]
HTSDLPPLRSVIHSTHSVIERKSTFVGHAVKAESVEEATLALQHILTLKKVSKATHNILAYRLSSTSAATNQGSTASAATLPEVAGSDDDGESPAGKNLLELLHKLDVKDVLIVVTRWYGGVQLGPDRFRVINTKATPQVRRDADERNTPLPSPLHSIGMNDFDPLQPAAYRSPQQQQGSSRSASPLHAPPPGSGLSSVAPRSPLPGYDRNYRPPGFGPAQSPGGSEDAWSSPQRPASGGAVEQSGGVSAWGGTSPTAAARTSGSENAGLVPREPQAIDSPSGRGARRRKDTDEEAAGVPQQGQARQQQEGFVRLRIVGLDRNRRDIYIKFNAETEPSPAPLSVTCPQSIIPALPLAQTSAATDEEDDRLIKSAFQKWAIRLTSDPSVIRDEETRSFIESDFGYTPRHRKKIASAFAFSRSSRLPGEVDDPLTSAKMSMARLETAFMDTAKVVERTSKTRRATATAVNELGDQLNTFAMAEGYQPLANGLKRLARSCKVDADLLAIQSINEQVALGDILVYQSANARSAKDTLSNRDGVVEDHRQAAKATIQKRRNIEKLRSASSLKSDRVDEALDELAEAKKHETLLSTRLAAISSHLQPSLTSHSVSTHADLLSALAEHARSNLLYEKQRLKEYETLRPEMKAIKKPEAGVIYHTPPAGAVGRAGVASAAGMQRSASNLSAASSAGGSLLPHPQSPSGSPTLNRRFVGPGSPSFTPPLSPRVGAGGGGRDPLSGGGEPGAAAGTRRDLSSMAQKTQKRTVRSMASSVIVEGDRRQRVDARMAASMLANGF